MNFKIIAWILAGLIIFPIHHTQAQYRYGTGSTLDRTGQIMRNPSTEENRSFWGMQDFRMNHSYEVTAGSFAGSMYNQNMYTNTMHMLFNENLYGRVDLSMSHSPFGSGLPGQDNQMQFFVRNAELNYRINDNARVQLRFQQLPPGHGFGYHPGYYPPHYHRNRISDPFYRW